MEARILEKTRQAPPDGSTHWSTSKLGRLLHIHHNLVGKAWRRAGLQPHRFERYMQSDDPDFETNFRHGTLSLLAALNTKSGEVRGQTVPRHTSAAFVDFLGAIDQPTERTGDPRDCGQPVHAQDAGGSHVPVVAPDRTPALHPDLFLVAQPGGALVCQDRRDLLARGVFTSVADLGRKIRHYIRHYNKTAKPVRWSYRNQAHRISSTSVSTVH